MTDDTLAHEMREWEAADLSVGLDLVPNATANACIERDFNGNPFPGANQPPHICQTCAEWHPYLADAREAICCYQTDLTGLDGGPMNDCDVWTPADFGCRKWRAKETAQ